VTSPLDAGLGLYRHALALRGYRQAILTADIANASTPGFKAVDLNFSQAMNRAMGSDTSGAGMPAAVGTDTGVKALLVNDARHISASDLGGPGTASAPDELPRDAVQYQVSAQSTIDGNTVDLDQEKVTAAGNAVDYAATATFATQTIKLLLTAMGGAAQGGGA